jgi:hypothetical protein
MNRDLTPNELERLLWGTEIPPSDDARVRTLEAARLDAPQASPARGRLPQLAAGLAALAVGLTAFLTLTSPGQAVADWAAGLVNGDRGADLGALIDQDRVPSPDGDGYAVRVRDCPPYVADFYAKVDRASVPGSIPGPDTLLPQCPTPEELQEQLAAAQAAGQ